MCATSDREAHSDPDGDTPAGRCFPANRRCDESAEHAAMDFPAVRSAHHPEIGLELEPATSLKVTRRSNSQPSQLGEAAIALFFSLLSNQAVMKRKNTEEFPDSAVGFQSLNANGIVSREDRQLVNRAIRAADTPSRIFQEPARLQENLYPIKGLVRPPPGVAELGINLVESREIQVVRGSQKERSTWTGDTMEFSHCLERRR
jgi:hypothetical protein